MPLLGSNELKNSNHPSFPYVKYLGFETSANSFVSSLPLGFSSLETLLYMLAIWKNATFYFAKFYEKNEKAVEVLLVLIPLNADVFKLFLFFYVWFVFCFVFFYTKPYSCLTPTTDSRVQLSLSYVKCFSCSFC